MTIKLSSVHSESALEIICPGTYLLTLNVGQPNMGLFGYIRRKKFILSIARNPYIVHTYLPLLLLLLLSHSLSLLPLGQKHIIQAA